MRRGRGAGLAVLLVLGGCALPGTTDGAQLAIRACRTVLPEAAPPDPVRLPLLTELDAYNAQIEKAATLAAQAAAAEARWTELADAYSAYADAGAHITALWQRILTAPLYSTPPDVATELRARLDASGVSDAELWHITSAVEEAAGRVRSGCRLAAAAADR